MTNGELNIQDFANLTGHSRQSVRKWFDKAGMLPTRTTKVGGKTVRWYDRDKGMEVLNAKPKRKEQQAVKQNIDKETGLTWAQREVKEKARKLARENDEQDRRTSREWMRTAKHLEILGIVISKIEQIPGKAKSLLGLTDLQSEGLRRMLDEARTEAAKEVESK